jgi:hypothetical protein
MKLSDAILLGSTMKTQGFGALLADDKTCAMGAAYDAIGILDEVLEGRNFAERMAVIGPHFPAIASRSQIYDCPVDLCPTCRCTIGAIATHINDLHRWTREQIAEWITTVEPQDEQAEICGQGPLIATLEVTAS